MNYLEVLNKLESNDITPTLAYKKLYKEKKPKIGKRAFFIKMRIQVPDEGKKLNTFLKILFAIPFPMMFARMGLRIGSRFAKIDDIDIDIKEISRMLKYSKNTSISVDTDDAQVDIRII